MGEAVSRRHKWAIVGVTSLATFNVTFSSTSLIPAAPEIAMEFGTTTQIINITNACVLVAMGLSSFIWGPIEILNGRFVTYLSAIVVACGCWIGAALAINIYMFSIMRIIGSFTGTYFMIAGQAILTEIYEPVERGTAVGVLQAGSVSGPAIGPCMGGIIVSFTKWRVIYWLQTGLTVLSLILSIALLPRDTKTAPNRELILKLAQVNPLRIMRFFLVPNIVLADICCGLLYFFQFTLLTSASSIFDPRFRLTTPLVSGLFYLAPGRGFVLGSIIGGIISDRVTKHYIRQRHGMRLPQDRLNGGLPMWFFIIPISMLTYGWTLQEEVGGMAVPIVSAFFLGFGIVGSFNGLNTYTAEVIPQQKEKVMAGKYLVQYAFGAASSAAVLPIIQAVGVGLTFTICAIMAPVGGVVLFIISRSGCWDTAGASGGCPVEV